MKNDYLKSLFQSIFSTLGVFFKQQTVNTVPLFETKPTQNTATINEVPIQPTPKVVGDDLPDFILGQPNLVDSQNAIRVRKIIDDAFHLGASGDCLNCTEYVVYKIKTKMGVDIKWPVSSGRNGGKWGKIFSQYDLYKVSDTPTIGCAICFTDGISQNPAINEIGHVAFVEDVLPDDSIRISEANWPNNGKYSERTIPKQKWQLQYKAQFVNFA